MALRQASADELPNRLINVNEPPAARRGGEKARTPLDGMKGWLAVHNAAVTMVLFLFLGAKLIGDGLPVLGG